MPCQLPVGNQLTRANRPPRLPGRFTLTGAEAPVKLTQDDFQVVTSTEAVRREVPSIEH